MNYLIIGNGVAGVTAAETVRRHDRDGRITILAAEEAPFYQRTRLNDFIAGELEERQLAVREPAWYRQRQIEVELGCRAVGGDLERRRIVSADGREFGYDRLLLATGSRAFVPPIEGADGEGVFTLRSLADALALKERAVGARRAVLLGGGLLGLESGNALLKLGKEVTVVEFFPRLLPRQLDNAGAVRLQAWLEKQGFAFRLGQSARALRRSGADGRVVLEQGGELAADLVIISAGVRAELELARTLGLACELGIKVDDHLESSRPGIYAAGDAAQWRVAPYGIWPAGFQQGRVAGANMAGQPTLYQGTTMATRLKVAGIDLASAGEIDAEEQFVSVVAEDEQSYRKLVLDRQRLIGCILLGDSRGFNRLTALLASGEKIADPRKIIAETD